VTGILIYVMGIVPDNKKFKSIKKRRELVNDDEMLNTSGLAVPFILNCCLRFRISRTLAPQNVCKYITIFASKSSVLLRNAIVELEIEYSIVLPCLCNGGRPEVCQHCHV
jgi:hypothetical protein